MSRFRKKPVVIEAVQFADRSEECAFAVSGFCIKGWFAPNPYGDETFVIPTLEGEMTAQLGDWIIRGVQGEFYPCKPDIFDATYEPVPRD